MQDNSMLVIQDDTYSGSIHLDEVLLSAITDADGGAAAFAFASINGLNAIFNSDEFRAYCSRGHHFELYLGVDSITDDKTLRFAKRLSQELGGRLIVRVYHDSSSLGIFHPKVAWFRFSGGNGCLAFIGSGNLTMAGLQRNVEMFTWIEQGEQSFNNTQRTWNDWLREAGEKGRLFEVDDPSILEQAHENSFFKRRGKVLDVAISGRDPKTSPEQVKDVREVLISTIPSQKSRGWSQFTMAKEYYTQFFGFSLPDEGQPSRADVRRVLLSAVRSDGTLCPAESRTGNISKASKNYRMELDGARGITVEDKGHPVVVFLKVGPRSYWYQVFGTDMAENAALADFARRHNAALRGNQLPKCLVRAEELRAELPNIALLHAVRDDND